MRNFPLFDFLLSKGCPILAAPAGDPSTSVLHEIAKNIWIEPANLDKILNLIKKYVSCLDFIIIICEKLRRVNKNHHEIKQNILDLTSSSELTLHTNKINNNFIR